MEIIDPEKQTQPEEPQPKPERRRFLLTGLLLLTIGALLIANQLGTKTPDWIISWQMILIVVGIYIGEKSRFSNPGFMIPVAIGAIFLVSDIYPELAFRHFIIPVVIIFIGLMLILRPSRWGWRHHSDPRYGPHGYRDGFIRSGEDYLDSVSIFGSTKKNIMSKNFKGGEATSCFGGTELNLMQADIQGQIELELTQIFGGCKLIIPPHWEIKSELVNIFGGTDDKRPIHNIVIDHSKVVILRGTSIFGGIEIRSY
jgi:hypothetical protein